MNMSKINVTEIRGSAPLKDFLRPMRATADRRTVNGSCTFIKMVL